MGEPHLSVWEDHGADSSIRCGKTHEGQRRLSETESMAVGVTEMFDKGRLIKVIYLDSVGPSIWSHMT